MLELKQLRYFMAVADTLSFSKAAQHLYMTQSALSQQISRIEKELETELFARGSRSVSLTPAGQELYRHAVVLIRDAEDIPHQIRQAVSGAADRRFLRICMEDSIFPLGIEPVFRLFASLRETAEIELRPAEFRNQLHLLEDGETDMAISCEPCAEQANLPADVSELTLWSAGLSLLIPASWSEEPGTDAFRKRVSESSIFYPQYRSTWNTMFSAVSDSLRMYPHIIYLRNFDAAVQYVALGGGVVVWPAAFREAERADQIRVVPLESEQYRIRVVLRYRSSLDASILEKLAELASDE